MLESAEVTDCNICQNWVLQIEILVGWNHATREAAADQACIVTGKRQAVPIVRFQESPRLNCSLGWLHLERSGIPQPVEGSCAGHLPGGSWRFGDGGGLCCVADRDGASRKGVHNPGNKFHRDRGEEYKEKEMCPRVDDEYEGIQAR